MVLSNFNIRQYDAQLQIFNASCIKLPVKISFYLYKNIQLIHSAADEIENMRYRLGQTYGVFNQEESAFTIKEDSIDIVNQQLSELMHLEQDIPLHIFKLSEFDNIELTYDQISAIMFMVEED